MNLGKSQSRGSAHGSVFSERDALRDDDDDSEESVDDFDEVKSLPAAPPSHASRC